MGLHTARVIPEKRFSCPPAAVHFAGVEKEIDMGSNLDEMVVAELSGDVVRFVSQAAKRKAKMEEQRFREDTLLHFLEGNTKSPIEQMFYCAFLIVAEHQYEEINQEPYWSIKDRDWALPTGIYLHEQMKIGRYRADFVVRQQAYDKSKEEAPVVVELDGHQFHDRNKEQRSYEKARDRFFTRQGYRVVHFTGSDIVKDPYAAAWEVLGMLGGDSMDDYQSFVKAL